MFVILWDGVFKRNPYAVYGLHAGGHYPPFSIWDNFDKYALYTPPSTYYLTPPAPQPPLKTFLYYPFPPTLGNLLILPTNPPIPNKLPTSPSPAL